MAFEWSTNDIASMVITLYPTNITLNKSACRHFEGVKYVMLGIDREAHQLAIKPVPKKDIDSGMYPADQLHHISIGKSYGRVTSKAFLSRLATLIPVDFDTLPCVKIRATYDVVHGLLIADYKEVCH